MSDSVLPQRRQLTRLPIPGILQARTLEWVAISFSSAWKWKVKVKSLSCAQLLVTPWTAAYQAPPSTGFSRQEYWSGVPLPSPCIHIKIHKYPYVYIFFKLYIHITCNSILRLKKFFPSFSIFHAYTWWKTWCLQCVFLFDPWIYLYAQCNYSSK